MELDDELRARLRALAERSRTGLDDAARARVRARLQERAQGKPRVAPRLWLALPAACVLVATALAVRREPAPRAPVASVSAENVPTVRGPGSDTKTLQKTRSVPAPACADFSTEPAQFVGRGVREALLELPRARLVHSAGSTVSVAQLSACQLGLQLTRGDVAVHARDLRGGSLWIESALGRVLVRGTVFAVRADARGLRVAVVEGRVLVEASSAPGVLREELVEGGQVLGLSADGSLRRELLSVRERARLLTRLSLGERTEEARPSTAPDSTDAGAPERVWQQGGLEPRQAEPREPASSLQPDGRPMKKPHVTK